MPSIPQPARREPRSLPVRRGPLPLAGPPEIVGGVAKWEGVRVEAHLPEVAATGSAVFSAELESVLFDGCDLTAADISGATFALCELHRCEMQGIRGIEALRGARIPLADLLPITPLLADALGIITDQIGVNPPLHT